MGANIIVASLVVLFIVLLGTPNPEAKVLNFMLIYSGGGQYNSSGVEPAVDLAVEVINENNIIPGYNLSVASRGNSSVSN